jgi:hypothetical protein
LPARYAYPFTLTRRAVVATMDLSAANLELLRTDHWLSNPNNVRVLRLTQEAWQSDAVAAAAPAETPKDRMRRWRAAEVSGFLRAEDLEGPAEILFRNGVRGREFLKLTLVDLQKDLRLSRLASERVLQAREDGLMRSG